MVVHATCREPDEYFYDISRSRLESQGLLFWRRQMRMKNWWSLQLDTDLSVFAAQDG